jgi:lipopolysaccharide assembly outer membrane protein LptD (OstA)
MNQRTSTKAPATPRHRRTPGRRQTRLFLLVFLSYIVLLTGAEWSPGPSPSGAQTQRDDSSSQGVYYVTGDGSRLREINGEMVLEFPKGIRIRHDDVIATARRGRHNDARMITTLIGDVKIVQGTMTMWGDEGEYRRLDDMAIMRRNVRIEDEGWEVTCDEARYSRATERGWLVGDVVAKDSTTTLYADSLFYDRRSAMTEAFGHVRVTNPDEGFTVDGEHGFYFRDTGEGVIDREPRLTVEPQSDEPVTVASDTMRVFPDDRQAVAYYRVKILKGNTVTQCDSAAIYDNQNRAELFGSPLAKQGRVAMKGRMMALHYDEEEVNRIDIKGGAEIKEMQPDSLVVGRDNWIRGDTMSLHLSENRVDSIRVLHNATSEYYPTSPNKIESNFVRGDSMFFRFDSDSLRYVRITGTADGVYKFLTLSEGQTTDSLRTYLDTTLTYVSFAETADKVVYSARRIEYFAKTKDLLLNNNATIKYQQRVLTGKQIRYMSALQVLDASGDPKLVDQGQEFFGRRMDYDLEADAGLVNQGSTRFPPGYYNGENVAKVGENEMKVWNSRYTTCDLREPHYYIKAKYMKVYPKDKAVSGSTILYIGQTPVFYLPFIANSIRRGRRSGFLRPDFEFGITKQTGRYIRNIGYFWAMNDYTDLKFMFDFNEDRQTRVFARNRYRVRYKFDGEVTGSFLRDLGNFSNQWEIQARHNHTLGEKFTLKGNLRFLSDDDALKNINRIDDVENVVDRQIRSTLVVAKSWNVVSLNVSADRNQKLNVVDPNVVRINSTLPKLTLSIPSRDLFFGERSRPEDAGVWEKLLTSIRYSPGLSGQRTTAEKEFVTTEVITSRQSLGLQSPQMIGFVNLSPTISASNTYTRTAIDTSAYMFADSTMIDANRVVTSENEFTWSFGANASTNFYGTFYPRIARLRGIRHLVQPAVTYSFRPKFGSRARSQSVGLRLVNSFDLKVARKRSEEAGVGRGELVTRTPGTSSPEEAAGLPGAPGAAAAEDAAAEQEELEKISGFLIWSLSSNYNPEAPRKEAWSDINSAVNVRVFGTNVSLNQRFDPYQQKVLSTTVQTGFTLNGGHPFGRSVAKEVKELNVVAAADTARGDVEETQVDALALGAPEVEPPVPSLGPLEEGRLPWSLRVAFSYSKSAGYDPRATVDLSGNFDLTKNWRLTYWTSYDVEERQMQGQNFSVQRDLHCWQMSLSRQQLGEEWQFYFRISIKAHPEIYGETGQRGLGGFASGITSGSSSVFGGY